jgi:uncharacterized protein (UPF0262 family)
MQSDNSTDTPNSRIIDLVLDENSIGRNTQEVQHERQVAIFDLLEGNVFELENGPPGPYRLRLSIAEKRLIFEISDENSTVLAAHMLSLTPFGKIIKDYFLICESYYEAIKTAPPSRIEAVDMGRRGLHDEGSRLLIERLKGKIVTDFTTARRLFTLICALHWKG